MSKIVELTQGHTAIVDDEDFERVARHSWCIQQYRDKSRCTKIYAKASMKGTQVTLHRLILSPPEGTCVDHINGNGLDNRKENLRLATKQGNAANRPKDRLRSATSKYKGAYWGHRISKWIARIHVNSKGIYLGVFDSERSAAEAYDRAAEKYFGEFAQVNKYV